MNIETKTINDLRPALASVSLVRLLGSLWLQNNNKVIS